MAGGDPSAPDDMVRKDCQWREGDADQLMGRAINCWILNEARGLKVVDCLQKPR
jgi:hypothetical protein